MAIMSISTVSMMKGMAASRDLCKRSIALLSVYFVRFFEAPSGLLLQQVCQSGPLRDNRTMLLPCPAAISRTAFAWRIA